MQEKYNKDLEMLEEVAHKQHDKLNLSIILITLKCKSEEIQEVIGYFSDKGIEIVNEDVEPESSDIDYNEIDKRVQPFDPSKIDIKMDKITIDSIIKRIKNNELEFDSSFQRKTGLWTKKQKSQLIESIILKIPLPAFYFDASDDDKWQIIDGLQRVSTIKEFVVENKFALLGLEFLKDLNGLRFKDLPRSLQRRIEETNLNAYLVNPSTPKNVKFNIFKRINTGGLVLTSQEIRNALYQGNSTNFLIKMSNNKCFKNATDHSLKSDRMLDREFCLRYVAFTKLDLEEYTGNLDEYLNSTMEYLNKASAEDFNKILCEFDRTMSACYRIFGKFTFRRLNTEQRRGPINKALFEAWSNIIVNLSDCEIEKLVLKKEDVIKKFTDLCNKYSFQNTLRSADKKSVKSRIFDVKMIVDEILKEEEKNVEKN